MAHVDAAHGPVQGGLGTKAVIGQFLANDFLGQEQCRFHQHGGGGFQHRDSAGLQGRCGGTEGADRLGMFGCPCGVGLGRGPGQLFALGPGHGLGRTDALRVAGGVAMGL